MQNSIRIPVCLLAVSLFSTAPIAAKTITVNCSEGMRVTDSLAQLNPLESNTLRVTGTCHEFVYIGNFAQLSIVGVGSEFGHPTMQGIPGNAIFWIVGSHVQLQDLTMDGGLFGAFCKDFSVCQFSGNIIENNTGNGVDIDNADATFNGDLIQNNTNYGLFLTAARARLTQVMVRGTVAGPSGQGNGIEVETGSAVTVDGLTVRQNQGAGINIIGGHLTNQFWAGTFTVSENATGGIWITENSSGDLSGATVIYNTGAAGVVITGNSEASFWSGGTFTGNKPADVYCGPLNGNAAGPQYATIGFTNCPNTF